MPQISQNSISREEVNNITNNNLGKVYTLCRKKLYKFHPLLCDVVEQVCQDEYIIKCGKKNDLEFIKFTRQAGHQFHLQNTEEYDAIPIGTSCVLIRVTKPGYVMEETVVPLAVFKSQFYDNSADNRAVGI